MSVTSEKLSSNKVKLSFTIPYDTFAEAVETEYRKQRGKLRVPGFRPGKAPRKVIENLYGETVFHDDALNDVFPAAYTAAVEETGIEPVAAPVLTDITGLEEKTELNLTVEVFVRPDVTLGQYKDLEVEVAPKHEVTDEEIDARIEADRKEQESVTEINDRPVQDGDEVELDYAGSVDGVAFEGGTAEHQTLVIGSHQFIPGFEEQMIGMEIGDEKDLNVTFPEQYHAAELAGKAAVFHVKLHGINAKELPELDDEFAVDKGYDNLAAYKEAVAAELKANAEKNYETSVENALIEKAAENVTVDIPEPMIEDETEYILRDMERRMMMQGLDMATFLKYTGQTREQMAENYKGEAAHRLRLQLTFEAIKKAENLEADEEEVNAEIARQAAEMKQELEAFTAKLTDGQRAYFEEQAGAQKVLDFLKSSAKVTDKQPEAEKAEETAEEA